MKKALWLASASIMAAWLGSACMTRPVVATDPKTSNLDVEAIRYNVIDKIDLLFMIDNSQSMGDKQQLLAKAVPKLVSRLAIPRCISANAEPHERASLDEACPPGSKSEFREVKDIHVAVITSSIGALSIDPKTNRVVPAESAGCGLSSPGNDRAWLLPSVRAGLASYANTGFLAWDPQQILSPPGEKSAQQLGEQFSALVRAAGQDGCGYEASLEAWYRFLIDPEPPLRALSADGKTLTEAVDTQLLEQRAAFLRPDSLVAIVMLTDENDCSIVDDALGARVASGSRMPRSTSVCDRNPNDHCCLPCGASPLPSDCPAFADDAACQAGAELSAAQDSADLRCYEQKRRFGYDFLYPTSRYVAGLSEPMIARRSDGQLVENPLFKAVPGVAQRGKDLIYLAGIVGVPWQDIADPQSRSGGGLRYLSAAELGEQGRWDVIVGDPAVNAKPSDPFMQESAAPRSGQNPITGDPIVAPGSLNPTESPINGHEQVDVDDSDLQYACTFALAAPAACPDGRCDCRSTEQSGPISDASRNRPLCQPLAGGPAVPIQYFGKAYPGLRPLQVLKGIGESAIVASICPKVLGEGQPGYGYEPAVDAIVDRLKTALLGRCLPRPLAVGAGLDGKLPCAVVEALPPPAASPEAQPPAACSCSAARRRPASPEESALVRHQLAAKLVCDTSATPSCSSFCLCELAQAEGAALEQCLNDEAGSSTPGYCYVDPFGSSPQGNPELLAGCDADRKQLLRFVGPNTPAPGANAFIACVGATLH